jgi:hypothetical protein
LGELLPPALTSEAVKSIRGQFEGLDASESQYNAGVFAELNRQKDRLKEDAVLVREDLRKQLHTFAALAPEGEMLSHQHNLQNLLSDPDLEALLRR